jgi:hypothetical protein
MSVLTREEILSAEDIQIEKVSVSEWGGDVYVKGMTGKERDKFEMLLVIDSEDGKTRETDLNDFRAKLLSLAICDKDGTLLFSEDDIQALSGKSVAGLQPLFIKARELSGLVDEDIEELVGELEDRPFGDSASDSHLLSVE